MEITVINIESEFAHRGRTLCVLKALNPEALDYTVALFQPKGEIEGFKDPHAGIRSVDRTRITSQCTEFFREVETRGTNLAVAPEYSVPWQVMVDCLSSGIRPGQQNLWAMGLESMTVAEIDELDIALRNIGVEVTLASWNEEDGGQSYLDPLLILLNATTQQGEVKLQALVQFKTYPSSDQDEKQQLILGSSVFQLKKGAGVRFLALLCSDVLHPRIEQDVLSIYSEDALILHLQLNPKPRDTDYCRYRGYLFGMNKDRIELIALNWGEKVVDHSKNPPKEWGNEGGSAWYSKSHEIDITDTGVGLNHTKGLYFSRRPKNKRLTALRLNYMPGVYFMTASQVWKRNQHESVMRLRGAQMTELCSWNSTNSRWEAATPDDAFKDQLGKFSNLRARARLESAYANHPANVERLLALTFGKTAISDSWFGVDELEFFEFSDGEQLMRISYAQDQSEAAERHRFCLLSDFCNVENRLRQNNRWPPVLRPFRNGYDLLWDSQHPATNLVSNDGADRCLLVFIGDSLKEDEVDAAYLQAQTLLKKNNDIAPAVVMHTTGVDTHFYFPEKVTSYIPHSEPSVSFKVPDGR